MRRLILELSRHEMSKITGIERMFKNIKTLELIHDLRHDKKELDGIFRVQFEKPDATAKDLLVNSNIIDAQILEREKDGRCIVFVKSKHRTGSSPLNIIETVGGYLLFPLVQEDKLRLTFFGTPKQVTKFFEEIEKRGVIFKIIQLTNAKFLSDPLSALTAKQKTVITAAFKLGYYDFPRKINSEQLSKRLNIHSSALVAHRRKAERRLLAQILRE